MAAALAVTPALAARRLLVSVLLGGVLGLVYGFLRPPGRKHTLTADLVFLAAAFWIWLYICFGICRGDIRPVYLLGMCAGAILWEATAGRYLKPVFSVFWRGIARLFRILGIPWKKFLDFTKILFASAEKWVTIECTKVFESPKKRRKDSHGRKKHPAQESESGSSSRIQYP